MSHFLCGEITFSDTSRSEDSKYIDCLFRLIGAGAKHHLCIQFGPSIVQKIVFDILGSARDEVQLHPLPFIVLGSPISNTSDEIFYPIPSSFSPDERIDHLKNRIDEVILWVDAVFDEAGVVDMSIYLSEGYDTNYDQKKCLLGDLATTIYQTLLPTSFVPSTRIVITRT